ncbi:hypothetical protein [Sphingomonas oligophenolica]|uniref:Uncharacterized protein n=1 Tax=Sphingomonas oligophenolica TaxID=301154 RepID=A0A502C6A3_9SPHN|nr:hypothetical protein [Sphingomonas oligophenolica]TPG08438.1 hypothetical protein EAH84_14075 [Sphingomonas oligophenolica]
MWISEADLAIMRRIDELHLLYPFAGTRAVEDADEPLWEPGEVAERLHLQTLDPVASFLRMTSGVLGQDHQLDR